VEVELFASFFIYLFEYFSGTFAREKIQVCYVSNCLVEFIGCAGDEVKSLVVVVAGEESEGSGEGGEGGCCLFDYFFDVFKGFWVGDDTEDFLKNARVGRS